METVRDKQSAEACGYQIAPIILQCIHFVVSPNTAALSLRTPVCAGTYRDSCDAQGKE